MQAGRDEVLYWKHVSDSVLRRFEETREFIFGAENSSHFYSWDSRGKETVRF
jgi:hypothetical protein